MWIIPNNHPLASASAPDMVDSKEDLKELLELSTGSLMWRSSPSQLRTWLTRWNRVKWFQALSTRMLKLSHLKYFETELTTYLAATRASRSVQPEKEQEQKTQGTFGLTSEGQLTLFSQPSVFSKTWKDTSPWACVKSLPTWLDSDTEWQTTVENLRSEYSVRKKSEHHISEEEFSSVQRKMGLKWLTPTGVDIERSPEGMQKRKEYRESIGRHYVEGCLTEQVKNWPSATSRDWKDTMGSSLEREREDGTKRGTNSILPLVAYKEHNDGQPDLENDSTNGNRQGSPNWPTPTQQFDMESSGENAHSGIHLLGKVKEEGNKNWMTPHCPAPHDSNSTAGDGSNKKKQLELANQCVDEEQKAGCKNLREQVHYPDMDPSRSKDKKKDDRQLSISWPTARCSDAEGGRIETELSNKGYRSKRKTSNQFFGAKLRDAAEMDKPKAVKLNPDWVEALMGIPLKWTQLSQEFTHDTFDQAVECMQNRIERLRLLGNGVVPLTATKAFYILIQRLI